MMGQNGGNQNRLFTRAYETRALRILVARRLQRSPVRRQLAAGLCADFVLVPIHKT
jgi:hypothetical protein